MIIVHMPNIYIYICIYHVCLLVDDTDYTMTMDVPRPLSYISLTNVFFERAVALPCIHTLLATICLTRSP